MQSIRIFELFLVELSPLNNDSSQLQRGLKNRHIQLIAMGGAIGTGLFLGSAQVIQSAGPSIILGYAIGGLIAFLIMRQLGEMIVEEPVAGSPHISAGSPLITINLPPIFTVDCNVAEIV